MVPAEQRGRAQLNWPLLASALLHLALLLRQELEDRLARKQWKLEWADVIRDLGNLMEMEVTVEVRDAVKPSCIAQVLTRYYL